MEKKVSVIIPVFNVSERYLRRAVDSVREQTYTNWELILIDDCSSNEETLEAEKQLSKEDPRISLFVNDHNAGIAFSRNRGIRNAKGEWIAFLDHDDFYLPDFLESLISCAKENIYVVVGGYVLVDDNGNTLRRFPDQAEDFSAEDFVTAQGMVWNRLYRKSFLEQNNISFPEGCFVEDNSFLLKCIPYLEHTMISRAWNYVYCIHSFSTIRSKQIRSLDASHLPFDYVQEIIDRKKYLGDMRYTRAIMDLIMDMGVWLCYRSRFRDRVQISKRLGKLMRSMGLSFGKMNQILKGARNRTSGKWIMEMLYLTSLWHCQVPLCLLIQSGIRLVHNVKKEA